MGILMKKILLYFNIFLAILHFCKSFWSLIFFFFSFCVLKWQNTKHGKLKGELEVCAQSQSYGAIGITEMQWESLTDCWCHGLSLGRSERGGEEGGLQLSTKE